MFNSVGINSVFSLDASGKRKAHTHKYFWQVTPPVTGQSPDREARSHMFINYLRNPRNINRFARVSGREYR